MHFGERIERDDGSSVWFGFVAVANDTLGDEQDGGVTVLAGFDARKTIDEPQDLLFLRGL